jgi:hypothetical protein
MAFLCLRKVLKTVYTRAGEELTDPQEGCKLRKIQTTSSGEQPCLGGPALRKKPLSRKVDKCGTVLSYHVHLYVRGCRRHPVFNGITGSVI